MIRKELERDNNHLPRAQLWSLGRPIEIGVILKKAPPDAYAIFRSVSDALNQVPFVASFAEEGPWLAALELACRYLARSGSNIFALNAATRGASVAAALLRLQTDGFESQLTPYGVGLTDASLEKACAKLEKIIRRLGGINVAANVFSALERSGRTFRGLFLYGRHTDQIPRMRAPTPPWNFIYNVALKHLDVAPSSKHGDKDWQNLIALATDVGASVDVEEYSAYGWMSISPYVFDKAIIDNTLYDELFSFQQWSTEGAAQLFDW